ncbi:hypothetical protein Ae201684P_021609 [Aphanomyces euteiches]|nr:hypothetical protein Ae201684P_021609 [Aphanomyces euteiches]
MTQSLEETWLQDLQFLIATDDHLQEELANVCEILNSDEAITSPEAMTSSPTSSSTLDGSGSVEIQNERGNLPQEFAKVKPKPQRTAVRQREEILSLQKQIKEMTEILNADKLTVMVNYDISLLLVKPLRDDPNRSRFTLLEHLAWPRDEVVLEEKEIGIVLNQLESLCFGFKENRCGMLPATAAMDLSRLPFPTMSAFVERGYWFLDLLRTKLNDTIENYHR